MTSRIDIIGQNGGDGAHYDLAHELPEPVIESDLTWLARNLHEWPLACMDIAVVDNSGSERDYRFPLHVDPDQGITKQQWLDKRARLQNKPSWSYAPKWANYLAQDLSGQWHWYESICTPGDRQFDEVGDGELSRAGKGEVLGDWRNTLEKRPDHIPGTGKMVDHTEQPPAMVCDCDGCTDGDDLGPPPSKYHVVINGGWVDVYDVLWSFKVANPATAHAIKKLLKPGQRGHKDEITDLTEAAQSIARAIELIKQ